MARWQTAVDQNGGPPQQYQPRPRSSTHSPAIRAIAVVAVVAMVLTLVGSTILFLAQN